MFKTVMLELTYRCNLKCSFCYLLHKRRLNKAPYELTTAEILRLVDRFKAGTHFYLSGGEPFLRNDIFEIMEYIKKAGFRFGLNTNGTLLDAVKIKKLAALAPGYVIFSLHGSRPLHDRLTGLKGAWRSLMRNMSALAAISGSGTEILVNCVVNRENSGELLKVYRAASRAGAQRVVFEHLQFLKPREASGMPAVLKAGGIIIPELEKYGADAALIHRQFGEIRGLKDRSAHFETRPLMTERCLDDYYNGEIKPSGSCARVLDALNVEPDGKVRLCVLYGLKTGHALATPLKDLLAFKKKYIGRKLPSGCARCCHRFELFRYF